MASPARPRLSLCAKTANSGAWLEDWACRARGYADEIVLAVDDASNDDTLDLARRVADRVIVFAHPPVTEMAHDILLREARGEWLLLLDDDEVMAPGFGARLPDLVGDTYLTHYWLPYRWVVPTGGGYGWLRTFPWHPNPRARLVRNVGSIFGDRGRLHAPLDIAGAGRVLDGDDCAIYHLDFVRRDRAAREAKVERYRGQAAPSCEEYYLWEDYGATLDVVPLDEEVVKGAPTGLAISRAREAALTRAEVGAVVSVAAQRASSARQWRTADVFSADYVATTTPTRVLANRGYPVEVRLRNTSSLRWRNTGTGDGAVVLSYHWSHPEHGRLLVDGDVALLPHEPAPGEEVSVAAGIWTPYDPGTYRLEWDLRAEGVNWFSERGVAPLSVDIDVASEGRLLGRPRAVAALPARAREGASPARPRAAVAPVARPWLLRARAVAALPAREGVPPARPLLPLPLPWASRLEAALRAGRHALRRGGDVVLGAANAVPVGPLRALDTRDGTGFPGAT
ncbi:MAG: glycosyltransferase, partial [Acidimicrobiales bacterium]